MFFPIFENHETEVYERLSRRRIDDVCIMAAGNIQLSFC